MTSPFEVLLRERYAARQDPTVSGVVTAIVTGRMPDGTYELDYLSMGAGAPSAPARVMAPVAGARRGAYAMPEEGDEVVVAFDAGDPNNPIILGGVWNDPAPVPDQAEASDANHVRAFVSRSGHHITFDDRPAAGKVKVRTNRGHEVLLDDTLPGTVTITSAAGVTIELDDATQSLTLRAAAEVRVESAAITLAAGTVQTAPAPPDLAPAAPPLPTRLSHPVQVAIESPTIALRAAAIELTTTGNPATSMVVIDGTPFGAMGLFP
ncbi:MAG: hypothetical protein KTR31_00535 [Myxococcales bacterium]|nr:hypothetical protein [Myxococcales bacterium]